MDLKTILCIPGIVLVIVAGIWKAKSENQKVFRKIILIICICLIVLAVIVLFHEIYQEICMIL